MNLNQIKLKKVKAATLAEVLFVVAILGILAAVTLPFLMPLATKAKATEAQLQLEHIHNLQTQYRFIHSKYSMELNEIDFEAPKSALENGSANYRYEIIEASTTSFKARAEAVIDFDGDGITNVWEIDENGNPTEKVKD